MNPEQNPETGPPPQDSPSSSREASCRRSRRGEAAPLVINLGTTPWKAPVEKTYAGKKK